MEHLECPKFELWQQRRSWFEAKAEPPDPGGYLMGEQACALAADLQCAFCAGAWTAVIIVAASVIDAHFREAERLTGSAKSTIDQTGSDPLLHKLRKRRNALVHVDRDDPAVTVDQQWLYRANLEKEAREAVELAFRAIYSNPWV